MEQPVKLAARCTEVALNGFLQIKEPGYLSSLIMAPEANVLKRKQRDCFTAYKEEGERRGGGGWGVR